MTTEMKTELAMKFVSAPVNTDGAHDADRHLCTFRDVGVLAFKFSDRGDSCPGLAFYVWDNRRDWFEQQLSQIPLPPGFHFNACQMHQPQTQTGWVAFIKDGIESQEAAYADIVNPGKGLAAWRACFAILCQTIESLTNITPTFHGLIQ